MKRHDFVLVVFFRYVLLFGFFCCECVSFHFLLGPSEVAFGQPCKRLGHQNHDGPYRQSHHCSNLLLFVSEIFGGKLGEWIGMDWDILGHIAHIGTLGTTVERPLNDLI